MRARLWIATALILAPAVAHATPSALGLQWFGASTEPKGLLAQRTIEREWPVYGDSGMPVPRSGQCSGLAAMTLSAVVPGAGQLYAGEGRQALGYAAVEVAGWAGWAVLRDRADRLRGDASALAGAPGDPGSAWSFERYETVSGADASQIRSLYSADREAFYDAIGSDARYAAGWNDGGSRTRFGDLRRRSEQKLESARWTSAGIWVNHLVAAVQALRAVRLGNMNVDLGNHVELKAHGRLRGGRPSLLLTLERRF